MINISKVKSENILSLSLSHFLTTLSLSHKVSREGNFVKGYTNKKMWGGSKRKKYIYSSQFNGNLVYRLLILKIWRFSLCVCYDRQWCVISRGSKSQSRGWVYFADKSPYYVSERYCSKSNDVNVWTLWP